MLLRILHVGHAKGIQHFTAYSIMYCFKNTFLWRTQWHCTTSQKVAGLIPDGVTGIFH
jgi:hypothetical protein